MSCSSSSKLRRLWRWISSKGFKIVEVNRNRNLLLRACSKHRNFPSIDWAYLLTLSANIVHGRPQVDLVDCFGSATTAFIWGRAVKECLHCTIIRASLFWLDQVRRSVPSKALLLACHRPYVFRNSRVYSKCSHLSLSRLLSLAKFLSLILPIFWSYTADCIFASLILL